MAVIKRFLRNIVNAILTFFYIFSTAFAFIPVMLRTRMYIGAWGCFRLLFIKHNYGKFIIDVVLLNLLFVLSAFCTYFVTGNLAWWFIQHGALNVVYMFGGLYLAKRFLKSNYSFYELIYFIVVIIVIHNVIAFVGYIFPNLGQWIVSNQLELAESKAALNVLKYHSRAIGFGTGAFFHGGVISGLGIILICYLISQKYLSTLKGSILLLVLFGLGNFIARTTMMGLIGLLIVFIRNGNFRIGLFFKFVFGIIFGGLMVLWVYESLLVDYIQLDRAFELIINFMDKGSLETDSTNELKTMWVLPDNFRTWIFGDGLFFNRDGSYYKHTDVGYLRTIYAIGLIGLLAFIGNQIFLMKTFAKVAPTQLGINGLAWILGLYVLLLNIKGFSESNYFMFLVIGFLKGKAFPQEKNRGVLR